MTVSSVEWGYEFCQAVTRREAANFYYGIRLLPKERRAALCAIYALARRVDDIGDGTAPDEEKLRRLGQERKALGSIETAYDDPVLVALTDASSRYPIPLDAFGDLIDGVEMDVRGTTYETFAELLPYCRRVAGAIGRLSLGVFETREREEAETYADDLGVGFQLTNIIRDVREDLARGRVYIPEEDLSRFECRLDPLGPASAWLELIGFEADRAHAWFESGLRLLPLLDRQSGSCVAAMAGIYRRLLTRIERRPELVLRGRVSLPTWEKGWVAVRSIAAVGP
jgi:15-cis-phytoene synthase